MKSFVFAAGLKGFGTIKIISMSYFLFYIYFLVISLWMFVDAATILDDKAGNISETLGIISEKTGTYGGW